MLIKRLNVAAQAATELAGRLAVKQGQRYIGPGHLLQALLQQEESRAGQYLRAAGTDISVLQQALQRRIALTPKANKGAQRTPINRQLDAVFMVAEETMQRLGKRYISPAHLLLGMLEDEEIAADLVEAGTDLKTLQESLKLARTGSHRGSPNLADYEFLGRYGIDLTERAREGKLDPVIGRDAEVRQIIQVLCRRLKNNPVIVGEPGVGKTALVEGLARRIAAGSVPENLQDHAVVALDLGTLVAGTKFRGEFEERFKTMLEEVSDAGNVLLFIDELHMLVGTGGPEGGTDASNLLKPALSRGEFRCIGATTSAEYRKRIAKDSALSRRFQLVPVDEPTVDEAITILRGLRDTYELHHAVRITDPAINAAVKLADRYITDRFLPDKAIDLMDQAAATLRMELASSPQELEDLEQEVVRLEIEIRALERDHDDQPTPESTGLREELEQKKAEAERLASDVRREKEAIFGSQEAKRHLEAARRELVDIEGRIRKGEYDRPEDIGADYDRVLALKQQVIPDLEARVTELESAEGEERPKLLRREVGEGDVAETLSRTTGIPVSKLVDEESARLMQMEDLLRERVLGQDEAVAKVARTVRRARAGMQDPNRPLGSFLMLGPTGVGKTELSKALAHFLFGDERAMVRIDMSEFMEKHSVARLVGAPPGYVGYEEGGTLTNQVKRRSHCVILLDEVEKAHADVFNLLLQVLDDGRLTDGQGATVNFKNAIIILTSNLGAGQEPTPLGYEPMKERVVAAVRKHFRPEFLNRLDDMIVFHPLSLERMRPIAELQVQRVAELLHERRCELALEAGVLEFLANRGFDPQYGARPLRRVIQTEIQDPIADLIVAGTLSEGQVVTVARAASDAADGALCFRVSGGDVSDCSEAPKAATG
ncbi:MAG: AAA family ATPase [Myxococcales bacterium]|nr:AAA family ATPase [Myxococcales bacterium]